MKDRDVKKATNIKIAETIIFPTVTYGCDSWTVRKKERKKLMLLSYGREEEFYEFPGQRRKQEDVKPKGSLKATILRLKLRYFGHVVRTERSLERDIMLGHVEGHRKYGKPRMRWLDSIKVATGLRLEDQRHPTESVIGGVGNKIDI